MKKGENTTSLIIPVPLRMHANLKQVALKQGRSMSAIVREGIDAILALAVKRGELDWDARVEGVGKALKHRVAQGVRKGGGASYADVFEAQEQMRELTKVGKEGGA